MSESRLWVGCNICGLPLHWGHLLWNWYRLRCFLRHKVHKLGIIWTATLLLLKLKLIYLSIYWIVCVGGVHHIWLRFLTGNACIILVHDRLLHDLLLLRRQLLLILYCKPMQILLCLLQIFDSLISLRFNFGQFSLHTSQNLCIWF